MTPPRTFVLDSSALLAFVRDEPGANVVWLALRSGAAISTVNWAESLTRLSDLGYELDWLETRLAEEGASVFLGLEDFTAAQARGTARLRPASKQAGLSIGDRACLALAQATGLVALTADRRWSDVDVGVEVRQLR